MIQIQIQKSMNFIKFLSKNVHFKNNTIQYNSILISVSLVYSPHRNKIIHLKPVDDPRPGRSHYHRSDEYLPPVGLLALQSRDNQHKNKKKFKIKTIFEKYHSLHHSLHLCLRDPYQGTQLLHKLFVIVLQLLLIVLLVHSDQVLVLL